jgi:hypothetical protein
MLERIIQWIAWHLPKKLVYWCAIRLMSYATFGKYENTEVPVLTAVEALNRWAEKT